MKGAECMDAQITGFDGVVIGRPNTLAVAIAKKVVRGPVRKRSNPFVIEGECGFGKTTILNAIATGAAALKDGRKVIYSTGDQFVTDYCEALRQEKMDAFRKRYETVDVLLLDQLEALKNSITLCDVLLHILDTRMGKKRQTVVATSVRLEVLQHKERAAELVGRLMSGVVVRLGRPDKRMRTASIRRELRESNVELPDNVIEAIANVSRKNMWCVGGQLHRVMFALEEMGQSALRQKNLEKLLEK